MKSFWMYIALLTTGFLSVMGQRVGEIQDAEVVIIKERELTLLPATRLYKSGTYTLSPPERPKLTFKYLGPTVSIPDFRPSINPAQLEKGFRQPYFRHDLTAGFGNYLSPLAHYQIQGNINASQKVGGAILHESFLRGPVRDNLSSQSVIQLRSWYDFTKDKQNFSALVNYQLDHFYAYGISDSLFTLFEDQLTTSPILYQQFDLQMKYATSVLKDKLQVNVSPLLRTDRVNYRQDDAFNQQILFGLGLSGSYQLSKNSYLNLEQNFTSAKYTSGDIFNRSWYQFAPAYHWFNDRLSIKGGFNSYYVSETSGFRVFPDMRVHYQMYDRVGLYVKSTGDIQQNRLHDVMSVNPWIQDSLQLRTSSELTAITFGTNGILLPRLSYDVNIGVSTLKDQLLMVNSARDSSRFDLIYDNGSNLKIHYVLTYEPIDKHLIKAAFTHINYRFDSALAAWHLPSFIGTLSTSHQILPKWKLSTQLFVADGIVGMSMTDAEQIKLPMIFDASFNTQYQLKEGITIFFDVKNLLNRENSRFLNYPNRGLMLKAGILLRF